MFTAAARALQQPSRPPNSRPACATPVNQVTGRLHSHVVIRASSGGDGDASVQEDASSSSPAPRLSLTEQLRLQYTGSAIATPAATPSAASYATTGVLRKALGVDYGTVWTGLAVKAADGLYEPLQVVRTQGSVAVAAKAVLAEGQRQGVDGFVVGLPLSRGGHLARPATDNLQARRCRQFAHALALMASRHGLVVLLYNEADTTRMAKYQSNIYSQPAANLTTSKRQKQQTDAWAARMLLHLYYAQPQLAVQVKC